MSRTLATVRLLCPLDGRVVSEDPVCLRLPGENSVRFVKATAASRRVVNGFGGVQVFIMSHSSYLLAVVRDRKLRRA